MPWPQRLNDDEGHIVPNGSDDVKYPMMMTDYMQFFVFIILITDVIAWLR